MERSFALFVVAAICLCAYPLSADGAAKPCSEPASSTSASSASTPTSTSASPAPTPTTSPRPRPARLALPGVRPMKERVGNSSEPVPCTCGIFLSSQCKGTAQPVGLPAISHEFNRATSNTAYGIRQCTSACVDMIVKHLPNSAAILCSSVERDCVREKAHLFIKNVRNKWLATRLSAGREFCCKGGIAVKCPK